MSFFFKFSLKYPNFGILVQQQNNINSHSSYECNHKGGIELWDFSLRNYHGHNSWFTFNKGAKANQSIRKNDFSDKDVKSVG